MSWREASSTMESTTSCAVFLQTGMRTRRTGSYINIDLFSFYLVCSFTTIYNIHYTGSTTCLYDIVLTNHYTPFTSEGVELGITCRVEVLVSMISAILYILWTEVRGALIIMQYHFSAHSQFISMGWSSNHKPMLHWLAPLKNNYCNRAPQWRHELSARSKFFINFSHWDFLK